MDRVDYHAVFNPGQLSDLFPRQRTDRFFEALYGDAGEGAYDIVLVFREFNQGRLHFEFHLKRRGGKCLACNLTYGLPAVFLRHPVIDLKGLVNDICKLADANGHCADFQLGATREVSPSLHIVPLSIQIAS
ncbi:MAG: pancreas/duodenum homeobox protein 1 [Thermodesulfobacteriota bacterium]